MPDGTFEPVRCGSPNRCSYCATLAAFEAATVISLDAAIRPPTVGLTTTTRREGYSLADFGKAKQALWRQLRRELEPKGIKRTRDNRDQMIEYCGFLEFTTGETAHAHGVRRAHEHSLVKGVPADHPMLDLFPLADVDESHPLRRFQNLSAEQLEETPTCRLMLRVSELWFEYTGDAFIVDVSPLRTVPAAIRYLALHNRKRSQAPPVGFAGRRLRPSKFYYEEPIAELRILARKLNAHRRVEQAVSDAIAGNLFHESREVEADEALTTALVAGLRSLAEKPTEYQFDLISGDVHDPLAERRELVARTVAELERIRNAHKPELVYVRERREVDEDTGEVVWRATSMLGPVEARVRQEIEASENELLAA